MQPFKKRAVELPSGDRASVPMPSSPSCPSIFHSEEGRRKAREAINIIIGADEHITPEWDKDYKYDPNEDLINITIEPKPEDMVTDPEGNRLIIQDVYVENFKSYKGYHQLGPFHKNLTMILGPNGSGKSNIIDALLFVFGFKNKKIRTNRLTSLIHSSNDCDFCEVVIHFQVIKDINEETFCVLKNSQFQISRSVRKDGLSQYKLNGHVTKQEEITTLLKRCGIDLNHNRFLILQGEVEAIALMKPTTKSSTDPGMLEYIEDIVGTQRYVPPINKLAYRIQMLEISGSRHAAQKRKGEDNMELFRAPMQAVVTYINECNEMYYWESVSKKNELIKLASVKQSATQELEEVRETLATKTDRKKAAQKIYNKKEARLVRLTESLMGMKNDENDMKLEQAKCQVDIDEREAAGKAALGDLVQVTKKRELAEENVKQAMKIPEETKLVIAGLRQEIDELMREKEACEKTANENFPKYEEKSVTEMAKRDQHAADYASRNAVCNQIQTELTVVENELKDMKVTARQDEKRLDELRQALKDNTRKGAEGSAELQRLENEIKAVGNQLNILYGEVPDLKTNEEDLCQRKAKYKAELDEQNAEISNVEYRNPSTARFHELKAQGRFDKFYGRLGDLGSVEKKYDAPLSTIFGQLDYHIVEDEEAQLFAMNWAYENGLGRTTFFHFGLISESDLEGMDASPNQFPAPRLFDKIRCNDEKVRKVFYYVVKDLLVVNNLAEATRLDQRYGGEYRVCSLDGSIIERTGNMTGGGRPTTNRIRTGAAPPIVTSKQMKKKQHLQSQYDSIVTKLDQIRERIRANADSTNNLKAQMEGLGRRRDELAYHVPRYQNIVQSLEESIRSKEERIKSQDIVEITVQDIEAKNRLRDELKQRLANHMKDAEEVKANLDEFDARCEDMFKKMVGRHRDKAKKFKENAEMLELDIVAKQRILNEAPKVLEQAQNKLDDVISEHMEVENRSQGITPEQRDADHKNTMKYSRMLEALTKLICEHEVKLTNALQEKAEKAVDLSIAIEEYEGALGTVREVESTLDHVEGLMDRYARELEEFEGKFMKLETSDPHCKLVRHDAADAEEKIMTQDFIPIPKECTDLFVDWKAKLDAFEITHELPVRECEKINQNIKKKKEMTERYRVQFDEKGVSQFSILCALIQADTCDHIDVTAQIVAHREKLQQLRRERLNEFSQALSFLATTTQMLYQMITSGGDACLKFVEEGSGSDPFDAGIKFGVRPPKKSWKLIENLSGGEKTLASLCFVFAIHHYRATPLYVMDEIDAALDLNNVNLIANYIKFSEKTRNAQFIIISLRNQMFEVGNRLVGIYKTHGCTHNVVVSPDNVENFNKKKKETLYEKIKEEERKRKEAAAAKAEKQITEEMRSVQITKKRGKMLGRLILTDFGVDNDAEEENEVPEQVIDLMALAGHGFEDEEEEVEDSDDELPVKKRRVRIQDDSDAEPTPTPSPPRPPRGGRRASRR